MRRAAEAAAVVAAVLAALTALVQFAPAYLGAQGFPVDEAWTAQVYARSLARTGSLAFNPGEATPGVASLLWTALLAPIAAVAGDVATAVLAAKLLGVALHAATALVLWAALAAAGASPLERALGAALIAAHPDLIAASTSGLEVPLAALAAAALLRTAQAGRAWPYAVASAVAPFVRADLALLACALPLLAAARADGGRGARMLAAGAAGSAAALVPVLGRDLALGGALVASPSPGALALTPVDGLIVGFRSLLGQIPILDSSVLVLLAAGVSAWRLNRRTGAPAARAIPAAFLGALLFCAAAFVAHPPVPSPGSGAFGLADQRWALPVVPLLVGPMIALLGEAMREGLSARVRAAATAALVALMVVSVSVHAPRRHMLLASDARTVDELGVAAGRLLATAPPTEVIWAATSPGALRYFGGPRVVDLSGVNGPALDGPDASRFLAAHAPRYIEIVPGRAELDAAARARVKAIRLERPAHEVWIGGLPREERWIVLCAEPGMPGRLGLDHRVLAFSCAPPGGAPAASR